MLSVAAEANTVNELSLISAILLYGTRNMSGSGAVAYATVNEVDKDGVIGAGQPLSMDHIRNAIRDLNKVDVEDMFVDDRVLAKSDGFLMWWRKPQRTKLWFQTNHLNVEGGAQREPNFNVDLDLPGLVFVVSGGSFAVYVSPGAGKPARTTSLLTAPFMNVWDGGKICTGNVKLPASAASSSIDDWERAFVRSRFTHFNHGHIVNYEGGHVQFWNDWIDGKFTDIPSGVLLDAKLTIETIVKQYANSKRRT